MDTKLVIFLGVIVICVILIFLDKKNRTPVSINGKQTDCYVTALGSVRCPLSTERTILSIILFAILIGLVIYY